MFSFLTDMVNISTSDQTRCTDVVTLQILVNSRQKPHISDQKKRKGRTFSDNSIFTKQFVGEMSPLGCRVQGVAEFQTLIVYLLDRLGLRNISDVTNLAGMTLLPPRRQSRRRRESC